MGATWWPLGRGVGSQSGISTRGACWIPPLGLAATGRSRFALDPGGRLLAVGDPAGTVQLWDLASPGHPYLARLDVEGAVTALTFLPPPQSPGMPRPLFRP